MLRKTFYLLAAASALVISGVAGQAIAAPTDNLIPNPSVEIAAPNNAAPQNWRPVYFGDNTANFKYPAHGTVGEYGVWVTISDYQDGAARWVFDDVPVTPGQYEFSDRYHATGPTQIIARIRMNDGSFLTTNVGNLPITPTKSWNRIYRTIVVPEGAVSMTVMHSLHGNGTLKTDAYSLEKISDVWELSEGMVSLTFDDGRRDAYEKVRPILDAAGLPGTFYIVSQRLGPSVITSAEINNLYRSGHEIGAHTRTHADLTTLSGSDLNSEVKGSRQDLVAQGIKRVLSFAYPFGAYNEEVLKAVRSAGFAGARIVGPGVNFVGRDLNTLEGQSLRNTTTWQEIKGKIDQAVAQKGWYIMTIHDVGSNQDIYDISPALFEQIVEYLKDNNIKVVTVSQGIQLMQ